MNEACDAREGSKRKKQDESAAAAAAAAAKGACIFNSRWFWFFCSCRRVVAFIIHQTRDNPPRRFLLSSSYRPSYKFCVLMALLMLLVLSCRVLGGGREENCTHHLFLPSHGQPLPKKLLAILVLLNGQTNKLHSCRCFFVCNSLRPKILPAIHPPSSVANSCFRSSCWFFEKGAHDVHVRTSRHGHLLLGHPVFFSLCATK